MDCTLLHQLMSALFVNDSILVGLMKIIRRKIKNKNHSTLEKNTFSTLLFAIIIYCSLMSM